MSKWQEKTERPVLPVYMAALVWPIMSLLVPIYTLGGLVLTAAVSAGAYFAGTKLCPTRVVRTYVPYATGSEDVDAMLNGIAANLDALHKLNEAIPDPQLSRAMDRMEKAGRSIAAVVEKTPDKARSVDRFARYYLPEVVKLMGTYAALEQNGVRGENAAQIEAELRRNPTVKSEMEASGHALTGLLLTYPVHQACDILFCKANVVPIGKDNLPHVEITRTIARRFNERYAKKNPVFPEPAAILSEAPEIPGLDGRKMSKSYGNSIMLGATAEETAKLIKKSPTDSERRITFDPVARPQVSALLTTAGLVTGRDPKDIAEEIGDSGAGALKAYVIESVNEFLAPHRERRAELAKDMDSIRDILHDGNKRANAIAEETLDQVREAMGMKY